MDLQYRMLPFPPRIYAPQYLEDNPLGTVPMLVDGTVQLTESVAICQYLVARRTGHSLVVEAGEADYGYYLDFLHHADATLTFPLTVYMRFALFERPRGLAEAGEAYGRWFAARLAKLEARLDGRQYLCAGRFTLADIAVCYALWLAKLLKLDRNFGPNVAFYIERQMQRAAFIQAMETEAAAGQGISPSVIPMISGMVASNAPHN